MRSSLTDTNHYSSRAIAGKPEKLDAHLLNLQTRYVEAILNYLRDEFRNIGAVIAFRGCAEKISRGFF